MAERQLLLVGQHLARPPAEIHNLRRGKKQRAQGARYSAQSRSLQADHGICPGQFGTRLQHCLLG